MGRQEAYSRLPSDRLMILGSGQVCPAGADRAICLLREAVPANRIVVTGNTAYGCGGFVSSGDNTMLFERPKAATSPDQTHAGLVVGPSIGGDFTLQLRTATTRRLRIGSRPNPWEVGWVVWNYIDGEHSYYFIAKPNGVGAGQAGSRLPRRSAISCDWLDTFVPCRRLAQDRGHSVWQHHDGDSQRRASHDVHRSRTTLFLRPRRDVQRRRRNLLRRHLRDHGAAQGQEEIRRLAPEIAPGTIATLVGDACPEP